MIPSCFSHNSPTTARVPVNAPPIAGCAHLGTAVNCLNPARRRRSESVKATEAIAESRPRTAYDSSEDAGPIV